MTFEEIDRDWKPPARLGYSSLRPVRLAAGGLALVILAMVFAAGGLGLGLFLSGKAKTESARRDRLEREGVAAEAVIVRVWKTGGDDESYRMSYRFTVDGREFTGTNRVSRRIWRGLQAGDSLPVRYVPSEPAIHHPQAWAMRVTPPWVPVLVPVVFLGVSALFLALIGKEWRLLGEGRPAPGIARKLKKGEGSSIVYEFRLPTGKIVKGHSASSSRSYPGDGALICVLYDPGNPRRNAMYPMKLVKLDDR